MAVVKLYDELSDAEMGALVRKCYEQLHTRDRENYGYHGCAGALALVQVAHRIGRGFKIEMPEMIYKDEPIGDFVVKVIAKRSKASENE
ncbi:MAG: hypothetical protein ABIY70_08920 [Capsulimonas sp.]|uniref:hypothetical protein n=1 Tax=Capsulimonas sp. TaxID=2494211 RepID=UPI0032631226